MISKEKEARKTKNIEALNKIKKLEIENDKLYKNHSQYDSLQQKQPQRSQTISPIGKYVSNHRSANQTQPSPSPNKLKQLTKTNEENQHSLPNSKYQKDVKTDKKPLLANKISKSKVTLKKETSPKQVEPTPTPVNNNLKEIERLEKLVGKQMKDLERISNDPSLRLQIIRLESEIELNINRIKELEGTEGNAFEESSIKSNSPVVEKKSSQLKIPSKTFKSYPILLFNLGCYLN
jgi:hypothetical protein